MIDTLHSLPPTAPRDVPRAPSARRRDFVRRALAVIGAGALLMVFRGRPARAAEPEIPAAADGAQASPAELEHFEARVRPVLIEHCYECHSAESTPLQGGLRVDSRAGLHAGGDSGPAIVPGDPDGSLLLSALRHEGLKMPPEGKLPEALIEDFERWILNGAVDPRVSEPPAARPAIDLEAGRRFWAFQLPRPVPPPTAPSGDWPHSDIDRFILAGCEVQGLPMAADADRRVLLRRATFDLWGLPPSPKELTAFERDPRSTAEAFADVVDRLLESPRFGERWGRHWLDIARYADSTGGGRSMLYGAAWRYRDYVIDAFNQDRPLAEFILEQLAGDLLPPTGDLQVERRRLVATAFLVLGPSNYEEQDKEQLRMDVVDEQLDTVGRAFLGLTLGCARCHDHKFDPIPTADYYALAGVFTSTRTLLHDNVSTWVTRPLPLPADEQQRLDDHARAIQDVQSQLAALEPRLQVLRQASPLVTLDDDQAQFTGDWDASRNVPSFVGREYRYASGGAAATAAYDFGPLVQTGPYEVRVAYSPHDNRSRNALIRIEAANGVHDVRIDLQKTPELDGLYQPVGVFEFLEQQPARITILAESSQGVVIADAVQLAPQFAARPRTPQPRGRIVADAGLLPGVVVDDRGAQLNGDWKASTFYPSYVGEGYRHDDRQGKGVKTAVFRADLPLSGEYDVRMSYTADASRASKVPVRVTFAGGEQELLVDQRQTPDVDGLFHSLGRFTFNNDQTAVVTLTNAGTDDGYVIIDAVWFAPVTPTDAPTEPPPALAQAPHDPAVLDAELREAERASAALTLQLETLRKAAPAAAPRLLSVQDEPQPADAAICIRGNARRFGVVVPRGALQVIADESFAIPDKSSGRRQLADWIASPRNPLTARVFVNRVWGKLFGEGLVRSVDNFGATGERPSHPELLDNLACQFLADGGSLKRLIQRIMASRAYRLASEATPEARERDPENRWLSHQRRKRLEAECLRDSVLLVSGQLQLDRPGDTVRAGTTLEADYEFEERTRSVYLPVFRNRLHDVFTAFDFPDPNSSTGLRTVSTLPTQALLMMNSPFIQQQSRFAAERLLAAPRPDDAFRLNALYEQALGRPPSEAERAAVLAHLSDSSTADPLAAWTDIVQVVFASVDFRYVE